MTVFEPSREQVLEYCGRDPIERVFLEDVARRGLGRFSAVADPAGSLTCLCHAGANVVPSGAGAAAFAPVAAEAHARMIIGELGAVSELWQEARGLLPPAREDRPHQPVYAITEPPPAGETGLRPATRADVDRLVPACAAAHELELHLNPLARDPEAFRWRTEAQIDDGRSWLWVEGGVILFKAEASAWTPSAVQLQQVWVDPEADVVIAKFSSLPKALDPLDEQRTYQLWAITDRGAVSLGILGSSPGAHTFHVARRTANLALTNEPRGGSTRPTGIPIASAVLDAV